MIVFDTDDDGQLDIDEFGELIALSLTNRALNNDELASFINSGHVGGIRFIFKASTGLHKNSRN